MCSTRFAGWGSLAAVPASRTPKLKATRFLNRRSEVRVLLGASRSAAEQGFGVRSRTLTGSQVVETGPLDALTPHGQDNFDIPQSEHPARHRGVSTVKRVASAHARKLGELPVCGLVPVDDLRDLIAAATAFSSGRRNQPQLKIRCALHEAPEPAPDSTARPRLNMNRCPAQGVGRADLERYDGVGCRRYLHRDRCHLSSRARRYGRSTH
jgi:hypothetical protein